MILLGPWTRGLRLKLFIVCLIPAVALGLVAYFGIHTALKLSAELDKAYSIRAKLIERSGEMEASAHATMRMAWTAVSMDDPAEKKMAITKLREHLSNFKNAEAAYLKIPRSEKMIEMFKPVEKSWEEVSGDYEALLNVLERGSADYKTKATTIIVTTIRPHMNVINNTIDEIQSARREMMDKEVGDLKVETEYVVRFLIIMSAVSCLGSFIVGMSIASKTAAAIQDITKILSHSSEQVNAASAQIAEASQQLSEATSEQAASLEQTAASIEEMNSMVARNTENAKNTAQTSTQSQEKSGEGKQAVEKMMTSMTEINSSNEDIVTQVTSSNEQMAEIVKVIQEIGSKTKVINDIVFQTKLLSFNASVEAARAGEHGKGFAVVAEEVGALATMSGNAAQEISTMLDGSIAKVESIVRETRQKLDGLVSNGRAKVELGVEVAKQCDEVLNEIVHNVAKVSTMAREISSASQEQSVGISEITKAVNQLDQVTQQNAATSEETASSAEELSAQSAALDSAVQRLIEIIDGSQFIPTQTPESPRTPGKAAKVVPLITPGFRPKIAKAAPLPRDTGDVPDRHHQDFKEI